MSVDSPFDVLGIDPDADEEEIDRAYRQRAKETHPDQGGSARAFQRVRAAYEAIESGSLDEPDLDVDEVDEVNEEERTDSRVEYLNYEVLDDHGWTIDDDDLFEKASEADLDVEDYGRLLVQPGESLLEAAENRGFAWPYACRGGACANCAVAIVEGELSIPVNHILPEEMTERGIRLSCNGAPVTEEMKVVYNLKHLPELDDLRLPPRPFKRAHATD
jgi:curved DNA-binding protein CbpA